GLGGRVRRLEAFAIGHGLGGTAFDRMRLAMGHTGRGGVDQPADAVRRAGLEHVARADHVGLVIAVVAAPGAGLGGVVEDGVDASGRRAHGIAVGQVALHLAHAQRVERRIVAPVEAGDLMPAFDQATAQGLAEETPTPGDEQLHAWLLRAAQRASDSRPILALWRMSTGNFGWNTMRSMRAVCAKRAPSARSSCAIRACCAAPVRATVSTHSTGRCAPAAPMPTSAVRRTSGWTLNTGSTCSV